MIKEAESEYRPHKIEEEVRQFWENNDIREKSRKSNTGEKFYFVDGPPYTTGKIHLGTTWNKIIKDSFLRFKTLNGFEVTDTPGWDMHGLPIEVKVEKKFGFENKTQIQDFGLENFIDECKNFALDYKDQMTEQFKEFGSWFDWQNPYMTMTDDYIESVWWTTKRAEERGLLEQGVRVNNWCPRCETAIADSEVEYDEIRDPSIYVKFPVKDEENMFLVIWTTTPWTIPSNLAIGVHPGYEYSIVKATKENETEKLIIASDLIEEVLSKARYDDYEVLERKMGKDLEGTEYVHPLAEEVEKQREIENQNTHTVYSEDFVSVEKTGLVHMAPSHGEEDYKVGKKRDLPLIEIVGENGKFIEGSGKYESEYVRDANPDIVEDLRKNNLLLEKNEIDHRYGFCWRCDTPIIYLATRQWFINVTELKEEMVNEIDTVEWIPEWAGESRFKDWVSNAKDWCVSRQRFWGTPLPIWLCEECGKREVIGNKRELKNKAEEVSENLELHRPYVDKIELACDCGGKKNRVEDVMDVWLDSAVASWATLNYPKQKQNFEKLWPADFITEGHDQTRGWFYSQLGAGAISFDQIPYQTVLMHGFVLDEKGRKMSKSKGNVVQPEEIIEKFGSDTMRFYLLSATAPWDDLHFSWDECQNMRRTLNIFWNVYKFATTYMSIDNFSPEGYRDLDLNLEDKWILSKSQSLIKEAKKAMDNYQVHEYSRKIEEFILEDLSRWYVRLIRDRTWVEAEAEEKKSAYEVLYKVLKRSIILSSPIIPFITEKMYSNLIKNVETDTKQSVHIDEFPKYNENEHFPELEETMRITRNAIEAASHARQKEEMKLRWPVKKITIIPDNQETKQHLKNSAAIMKDQTNTYKLNILEPGKQYPNLKTQPKPNYDIIGPKFKQDAEKVAQKIENLDPNNLEQKFPQTVILNGSEKEITKEMVEFDKVVPQNISKSEFSEGKVFVDLEITEKIRNEGLARELVRRIQEMRKELELDVEEDIKAYIETDSQEIKEALTTWKDHINHETRAKKLELGKSKGDLVKTWEIEDYEIKIGIEN
ncbi:isoleucine--tRNA ligase [archaeon SCG-AAA382B04]|nr:isoleucine--tRNA ligase [archaeon SCG-AAA382B04]